LRRHSVIASLRSKHPGKYFPMLLSLGIVAYGSQKPGNRASRSPAADAAMSS
jgi:hypothetical protein